MPLRFRQEIQALLWQDYVALTHSRHNHLFYVGWRGDNLNTLGDELIIWSIAAINSL